MTALAFGWKLGSRGFRLNGDCCGLFAREVASACSIPCIAKPLRLIAHDVNAALRVIGCVDTLLLDIEKLIGAQKHMAEVCHCELLCLGPI